MNSKYVYYLSMVARVTYLCDNNATVLLLLPAFKGFITQLIAMKAVCDGYVQTLQGKTLKNTELGVALKKEISLYYSAACATISSFGQSIPDDKLIGLNIYNESELFHLKPEELKAIIITILKAIDDNKTALIPFGITTDFILQLTTLQTSLNDFNISKNLIDLHKNTLEALDLQINKIRVLFKLNLDPSAEMFQFNSNEFYKAYTSARKVPHHHMHDKTPIPADVTTGQLAIKLLEKITGLPALNVTLSILAINFIAISDSNGEYFKDKLLPAEYSAILTSDKFDPIEFTFIIKIGETTELGFIMEAKTPPTTI